VGYYTERADPEDYHVLPTEFIPTNEPWPPKRTNFQLVVRNEGKQGDYMGDSDSTDKVSDSRIFQIEFLFDDHTVQCASSDEMQRLLDDSEFY